VSELGYHLVLRLGDDRVIAPSRATRRRIASKFADLSRTWPILCWKLADTHLHLLVLADADAVTELVRRVRIWFTNALALGAPLELQRRKPLSGQSHLESTFHYVLRQDDHHGVETDRLHDASAILDILGLRVLAPEVPLRVREHLPRLGRPALLKHLGVDALEEASELGHLREAAAAAFGLDALGVDRLSVAARAAAILAVSTTRVAAAEVLGITPNSATRLARVQVPPRHLRAVRLQMALMAQKAATDGLFVREPPPASRAATAPRGAGPG
jgi:hypothetical protein